MITDVEFYELEKNYNKQKEIIIKLDNDNKKLLEKLEKYKKNSDLLIKLFENYKILEKENEKLISDINKSNLEIDELKRENLSLIEQFFGVNEEWILEADMAWRLDPITKEREVYTGLPKYIDTENVKGLKFTGKKSNYFCFDYIFEDGQKRHLDIPICLYKLLEKKKPKEEDKTNINVIPTLDKIKRNIIIIDKKANVNSKYFNKFVNFILSNRGEKIKTQEFIENLQIKSRQTLYDLLHDFERWGYIKHIGHSYWKIDF